MLERRVSRWLACAPTESRRTLPPKPLPSLICRTKFAVKLLRGPVHPKLEPPAIDHCFNRKTPDPGGALAVPCVVSEYCGPANTESLSAGVNARSYTGSTLCAFVTVRPWRELIFWNV